MNNIAFIGIGHMGFPMACNLAQAGYHVVAFDVSKAAMQAIAAQGIKTASSPINAVEHADVVISMLPEGHHVKDVYLDEKNGILSCLKKETLIIESSTIDLESAQEIHAAALAQGLMCVDAPVSGGTAGAKAASLTFMVGGTLTAFERAKPILSVMGKKIFYAGEKGCGQIAKMCNNLILGISMIGVSESFALAKRCGLDEKKLFEICSNASGQCWSLTSYCPVPDVLPQVPSSHAYEAGFMSQMMLKDLRLAQMMASQAGSTIPMGNLAMSLYQLLCHQGMAQKDFSVIFDYLSQEKE